MNEGTGKFAIERIANTPRTMPTVAPSTASSKLSAKICATNRVRLAPNAVRIAISPSRAIARTSRIFAWRRADDGGRLAVNQHLLADHTRTAAESLLPVRISKNDLRFRSWVLTLSRKEETTQSRLKAQCGKIISANVAAYEVISFVV